MQPIRVLVLCTNNSARSQMAEGFFRQIAGGQVRVDSAGTAPSRVHPLAIQVMQEFGVDLAQHTSKHLNQFLGEPIDVVLTVCDAANDTCPMFPGRAERLHWSYPDPGAAVGEAAQLEVLREIGRDMQARVQAFITERGGKPQELGAI